jgi:hypothetical protein
MKGDFFSRLAEKTLGVAPIAKPDLMPVFVATPESAPINDAVPIVEETMGRSSRPNSMVSQRDGSPALDATESVDMRARARPAALESWRRAGDMPLADDEAIDRELDAPNHESRSVEFRQNHHTADVVEPESQRASREFTTRENISLEDRIAATMPTARSNSSRTLRSPAPAIHISIGRVEVRAVVASTPVRKPIERNPSARLSLDQYLRQRNEGRR